MSETRRDIGCDDPERAARNRKMVADKEYTTAYEQVENYFTHTPLDKPLPPWMPVGELPVVDEHNKLLGLIDIQDLVARGFSAFDDQ